MPPRVFPYSVNCNLLVADGLFRIEMDLGRSRRLEYFDRGMADNLHRQMHHKRAVASRLLRDLLPRLPFAGMVGNFAAGAKAVDRRSIKLVLSS
jgi:hypothetical protein